jgi:hypothetical protein
MGKGQGLRAQSRHPASFAPSRRRRHVDGVSSRDDVSGVVVIVSSARDVESDVGSDDADDYSKRGVVIFDDVRATVDARTRCERRVVVLDV